MLYFSRFLIISILISLTTSNLLAKLTGQEKIDSLSAELPNAKQDTNYVKLLKDLSFALYGTNPDKGIEYGLLALELAKKLEWNKGIADSYNSLGVNYYNQSDYPKALEFYHKSLKINEELGNKRGIARNLGNIGIIYNYQSDYPKALEYSHKALKIYEELGNKSGIARNLGNIGNIYIYQSNYPKALEYYHKSLKINEELGNKRGIAHILGNIGNIYFYQSDYPKALEYYNKALKINEEFGNKNGIAHNLGNIGGLYKSLSQDSVLSKLSESTELVSLNKYINLNRGIEFLHKSINLFEEIGELDYKSKYFKILSEAYKEKGNYKKWGEYLEEFIIAKDSVFNEAKTKDIGKLEVERDQLIKEQKEAEAKRLEEEKARERAKAISYRNNMQYLSIAVLILLLGVIMMLNGKIQMSEWVARGLVFITFILFFEFILVVIDPITDEYSEGEPFIKLGINLILAFVLYPMHQFFNRKVTRTIIKRGGGTAIEKIIAEFKANKDKFK